MDRFPAEFEELLNRRGRRLFAGLQPFEALMEQRRTPIHLLEKIIDDGVARECIRLLDQAMYPHMRRMHIPVPREALTRLRENYEERLPKTMRVKTATFNYRKSAVLDAAREIGLADMMSSNSLLRCAQAASRTPLLRNAWGRQVICYERGDYSGPHNDHHPENLEERNGFIDFHVMFSNDGVGHQLLVYEDHRHFLTESHEISGRSALAIYRLPFWHYTTPLIPKRGREDTARRWLLLASFAFDPPLKKLAY